MFDRYEIVIENEDGKGYPITLTKKINRISNDTKNRREIEKYERVK